jgi:16S rRNA processing protein RimM
MMRKRHVTDQPHHSSGGEKGKAAGQQSGATLENQSSMAQRICVGRIGAAHGTGGEVKLWPFTAERDAIARYGAMETADRTRQLEIVSLRPGKDFLIARFKDIANRDAAERLRNVELFVPRARLPEPAPDEFYQADLIGLTVVDLAGRTLGRIVAVRNFGAGDLLEISGSEALVDSAASDETVLIPFTATMVPNVDVASRKVIVDPPSGLLNEASPDAGNAKVGTRNLRNRKIGD